MLRDFVAGEPNRWARRCLATPVRPDIRTVASPWRRV